MITAPFLHENVPTATAQDALNPAINFDCRFRIYLIPISTCCSNPIQKASSSSSSALTLLAASKHGRCTCLVYSCYASSWSFGGNDAGEVEIAGNGVLQSGGLIQGNISDPVARFRTGSGRRIERNSGVSSERDSDSMGRTFKSNLKKKPSGMDRDRKGMDARKVSWPDAHGQDIAHVREFEPSVSDDGELRGVKNSCVCAIQ